MEIRDAVEEDYGEYIKICQGYYAKHNIFSKDRAEILDYLKAKLGNDSLNSLLIVFDHGIAGGALLEVKERDGKGHVRFQINHLAAKSDAAKSALLDALTHKITKYKKSSIKTVKMEVKLAETETDGPIYLEAGFKKEGELASHYRYGEKVALLGKEI